MLSDRVRQWASIRNMHPRKLAGASLIAVVIVLVVNISLSTWMFGGSSEPRFFSRYDHAWRTSTDSINPYQFAFRMEQRSISDEWTDYDPFTAGVGREFSGKPSLTLRAWSAGLLFGAIAGIGAAYSWQRVRPDSDGAFRPNLRNALGGLGIAQGIAFGFSVMLIQELQKYPPSVGQIIRRDFVPSDDRYDAARTLVTFHDMTLVFLTGFVLVASMFMLGKGTWSSGRDRKFALATGSVLALSSAFYFGVWRDVLVWGYVAGTVLALALLIHAGWQTYRGMEFISNQPGLRDSPES